MKTRKIKKAIQIIELMQKQGLNIDLFDKNVNISIVDGVLVFDKDKCFVSVKENTNCTNETLKKVMELCSEPEFIKLIGDSEIKEFDECSYDGGFTWYEVTKYQIWNIVSHYPTLKFRRKII